MARFDVLMLVAFLFATPLVQAESTVSCPALKGVFYCGTGDRESVLAGQLDRIFGLKFKGNKVSAEDLVGLGEIFDKAKPDGVIRTLKDSEDNEFYIQGLVEKESVFCGDDSVNYLKIEQYADQNGEPSHSVLTRFNFLLDLENLEELTFKYEVETILEGESEASSGSSEELVCYKVSRGKYYADSLAGVFRFLIPEP